ncbi:hypothetical protein NPIL_521651 [Nephila pilipes]|uniref:Uncharacterized protein n=1 Tax=Nephila pilipes TaxID=299642 RepID=A0A8X6UH43_NEPPI|nr:hypothetical protein NPIL_521651 [Nephila pilipes]
MGCPLPFIQPSHYCTSAGALPCLFPTWAGVCLPRRPGGPPGTPYRHCSVARTPDRHRRAETTPTSRRPTASRPPKQLISTTPLVPAVSRVLVL